MGTAATKAKSVEKKTKGEVVEMKTKEETSVAGKEGTKRDIPVVEYTQEALAKLSQEELLVAMTPRISERRALKILCDVIEDGTVTIEEPATLADWTYKHVTVSGVDLEEVTGSKKPKVTLKKADFDGLDSPGMAKLIGKHTTEKRASLIMLALMEFGLQLTPIQVVSLSNNRIKVAGIALPRNVIKRDSVVLVRGVKVNGNSK